MAAADLDQRRREVRAVGRDVDVEDVLTVGQGEDVRDVIPPAVGVCDSYQCGKAVVVLFTSAANNSNGLYPHRHKK